MPALRHQQRRIVELESILSDLLNITSARQLEVEETLRAEAAEQLRLKRSLARSLEENLILQVEIVALKGREYLQKLLLGRSMTASDDKVIEKVDECFGTTFSEVFADVFEMLQLNQTLIDQRNRALKENPAKHVFLLKESGSG